MTNEEDIQRLYEDLNSNPDVWRYKIGDADVVGSMSRQLCIERFEKLARIPASPATVDDEPVSADPLSEQPLELSRVGVFGCGRSDAVREGVTDAEYDLLAASCRRWLRRSPRRPRDDGDQLKGRLQQRHRDQADQQSIPKASHGQGFRARECVRLTIRTIPAAAHGS